MRLRLLAVAMFVVWWAVPVLIAQTPTPIRQPSIPSELSKSAADYWEDLFSKRSSSSTVLLLISAMTALITMIAIIFLKEAAAVLFPKILPTEKKRYIEISTNLMRGRWRFVAYVLNKGILKKAAKNIIKQQEDTYKKPSYLDATIVGLLVGRKAKQNAVAYISLFLAFILYVAVSRLANSELNSLPLVMMTVLILSLYVNQKILGYRIANGLYGSNEYEAREIIRFILEHSDKSDFSSGGGLKDLLPEPRAEEQSSYETAGGEESARA